MTSTLTARYSLFAPAFAIWPTLWRSRLHLAGVGNFMTLSSCICHCSYGNKRGKTLPSCGQERRSKKSIPPTYAAGNEQLLTEGALRVFNLAGQTWRQWRTPECVAFMYTLCCCGSCKISRAALKKMRHSKWSEMFPIEASHWNYKIEIKTSNRFSFSPLFGHRASETGEDQPWAVVAPFMLMNSSCSYFVVLNLSAVKSLFRSFRTNKDFLVWLWVIAFN